MFRGDGAVGRSHIAVAVGIAVLIVAYRMVVRSEIGAGAAWPAVLGALLTFLGSLVLGLAFIEARRGWSPSLQRVERRLRLVFMGVFGGCVLSGTIMSALADAVPNLSAWHPAVVASCALAALAMTQWALAVRRRHPWPPVAATTDSSSALAPATPVKPEERQLAEAIVRLIEVEQAYRDPELRVPDLALRLRSAEHKVSRAITHVLSERNFNQLINRHRIAHACRLLEQSPSQRPILEISLDCGFASLGPFHRAFKAIVGCTPSAYRAARSERAAASA